MNKSESIRFVTSFGKEYWIGQMEILPRTGDYESALLHIFDEQGKQLCSIRAKLSGTLQTIWSKAKPEVDTGQIFAEAISPKIKLLLENDDWKEGENEVLLTSYDLPADFDEAKERLQDELDAAIHRHSKTIEYILERQQKDGETSSKIILQHAQYQEEKATENRGSLRELGVVSATIIAAVVALGGGDRRLDSNTYIFLSLFLLAVVVVIGFARSFYIVQRAQIQTFDAYRRTIDQLSLLEASQIKLLSDPGARALDVFQQETRDLFEEKLDEQNKNKIEKMMPDGWLLFVQLLFAGALLLLILGFFNLQSVLPWEEARSLLQIIPGWFRS